MFFIRRSVVHLLRAPQFNMSPLLSAGDSCLIPLPLQNNPSEWVARFYQCYTSFEVGADFLVFDGVC